MYERVDGCGQNGMYLLFLWALAEKNGWVFGGEIPLFRNHMSYKQDARGRNFPGVTHWNPAWISAQFSVDCECMLSMTGMPHALTERIDLSKEGLKWDEFKGVTKVVRLKDPFPIATGCDGVINEAAINNVVNKEAAQHYKDAHFDITSMKTTTPGTHELNIIIDGSEHPLDASRVCLDKIDTPLKKCPDRISPSCKQADKVALDYFFTPEFRQKMREAIKPNLQRLRDLKQFAYAPDTFRVAMHVRRGDITKTSNHPWRYIPDEYYVGIGKLILKYMPGADIHIFSQGKSEDFKMFTDIGCTLPTRFSRSQCTLHLDTADDITWAHMAEAQLFVLSDSSYGLVPAFYNDGIVVAPGHGHSGLGHWVAPRDLPVLLREISTCNCHKDSKLPWPCQH
jgi:hypothetical protein